jgi:hypothetical protein
MAIEKILRIYHYEICLSCLSSTQQRHYYPAYSIHSCPRHHLETPFLPLMLSEPRGHIHFFVTHLLHDTVPIFRV